MTALQRSLGAVVGDGGCEAYTVIGWGGGLSHERGNIAEAETLGTRRRQHVRHRYARCRRSAGVEVPITSERNASEPERSHVRPQAAEPTGPHREGEEPKPMMHGRAKSDSAVVATKPPNKAGRPAAEAVERRAEAKENANRCRTCQPKSLLPYCRLDILGLVQCASPDKGCGVLRGMRARRSRCSGGSWI